MIALHLDSILLPIFLLGPAFLIAFWRVKGEIGQKIVWALLSFFVSWIAVVGFLLVIHWKRRPGSDASEEKEVEGTNVI